MKAETRKSLEQLYNDPETMDVVCAHCAGGGTLVKLCEDVWLVPYGSFANWIRKDPVRAERYEAALRDRGEYIVDSVIKELGLISSSDIRELFQDDGSLKPVSEWPKDIARAVSTIKVDELFEGTGRDRRQVGWTKQVKFWDKTKALELLGKHRNMFVDRKQVDVKVSLEELVRGSLEPVEHARVLDVTPLAIPETTESPI